MDRDAHPLTAAVRAVLPAARRDLATLVAYPSVSAEPAAAPALRAAAGWLAGRVRRAGLRQVWIERTGGPPAVLASTLPLDGRHPGRRPHVLLYAHFDVQPAGGPGWPYPPFRLTRTPDGLLHGRGTADDKGPLLAQLVAVEAVRRAGVPVDVSVLLDGEEEVGSPHLAALLHRWRPRLRPDVALVCDTRMPDPATPAVVVSFRGVVTVDVTLRARGGARHAGAYGGAVPDPAAGLARLLAGLHDRTGLVAVPGAWAGLRARPPFTDADRRTRLPAVVVTTLRAGTGSAAVPAAARARLNVRTAPGQRTERVAAALTGWLAAQRPPGVTLTVRRGPAVPPTRLAVASPGLQAAGLACRIVYGRPPVAIRSGGTIAAVAYLQDVFGTPVVPLGVVPPGCRVHAAGERWPEAMLRQTAETVAWFLVAVAASPGLAGESGPLGRVIGQRW